MSSSSTYTRIVLNERPKADFEPNTFRTEVVPLEFNPTNDEVVVHVTDISLDPAMRGFVRDVRSYLPPVKIGAVMRATGLGVVVKAGPKSNFKKGDNVMGPVGFTEYAMLKEGQLEKLDLPKGGQLLDFLNTLGLPGLTAYFGLHNVGKIKKGERLFVSGAAGAVGSLVVQLGKKAGAEVIAIAGTQEKCDWLKNELGADKVLNYKSPTFRKDFRKCGYLDVFFDNVGGDMLDLALGNLNLNARIVLCGAISDYNAVQPKGLKNYMTLISQRATIQGFVIFDFEKEYKAARAELAGYLAEGSVKRKFHIVEGLTQAPAALPMLFSGKNDGKLVVKVSNGPTASAKL
ncbi:alcohol dehydrogenase [Pterulicium gracile]|uniref:Alcohol dehydrogenase n=1 Tax=Pterulicium gracile TaxID=1884261 RepID=A0A5C3QPG2_9AGAR|nr:alcohol dehydrogenase [Pterula gracilis]